MSVAPQKQKALSGEPDEWLQKEKITMGLGKGKGV
jgi:hypothetical protein